VRAAELVLASTSRKTARSDEWWSLVCSRALRRAAVGGGGARRASHPRFCLGKPDGAGARFLHGLPFYGSGTRRAPHGDRGARDAGNGVGGGGVRAPGG